MKELINANDKYKMNWIEGNTEWGTVKCPKGISVKKTSSQSGDIITERYTFTNTTDKDIFTSLKDISIYTPFNDDYTCGAKACMTTKCHTHIWCGENISYVMCLRMGGEAPHLGLVLTDGSLSGYSVERDFKKISNDRGDFILHPSPVALVPNESFTIEWKLFWHNGKDDFYSKVNQLCNRFINVSAENFVLFSGENINITVSPNFDFSEVQIRENNKSVDYKIENNKIVISTKADKPRKYSYSINIDDVVTHCNILVLPCLDELAKNRCHFIAENQQYNNPKSKLDGAYLIYDNEEKHIYYNREYDFNGGRERVGMGVLIAKYLQNHDDEVLLNSLKKYIKYVQKNLVCIETGEVFNDCNYDNSFTRLYNYPWFSLFYIELYKLLRDKNMLEIAYKIMLFFYNQGGEHFYAIEVPIVKLVECLRESGMTDMADNMIAWFKKHADYIAETALDYPAHEVNYEQSIVAPATNILLQTYIVTNETKYLDAAKIQLDVLELFNGLQPDYHLYETAIRHWDGYWFGKRRLYGDTFPHYWSALTGNAYSDYGDIIGSNEYKKRADYSHRSVLSLLNSDGTATCAYVYPTSINGISANYADPYANDQDWGLYFNIK